ncbi:MAG: hypothetical protein HYZ45_05890 [Burkholderiales bacterium]|nr:hypothetical protein [Burkholderiales bacterium]
MLPAKRTMALAKYAYDLGVMLPDFLQRIHICTQEESAAVIASGEFSLNGVALTDPHLVITAKMIRANSVARYREQEVQLSLWDDYDSGLR